jgi:transcriptional regulator with XRE-family HTH domain
MTQNKTSNKVLPPEVLKTITTIGERIRLARKRRNLTMEAMASRMFVTRKTLARLEKGDPGVSLAVLSSALWVIGLENDLKNIAIPEQDTVGIFHERKKIPQRVRPPKRDDLDF